MKFQNVAGLPQKMTIVDTFSHSSSKNRQFVGRPMSFPTV